MATMIPITIDGRKCEVPAGVNVVDACRMHGVDVPHYCYHPGLTVAGNCRMCLVNVSTSRRDVEIGCATRVSPDLVIDTKSPKVKAARRAVLEFLLINHPLDCPICDKAGECDLQNFSYEHGGDRSRFLEDKNIRAKKEFSADVLYWGTRCIACTRCVRFTQEITGTGELAMINRGDRTEVDLFPGRPLNNLLAGNVVDVCPVGALIDRHFLYASRVWNLAEADSICPHCAKGCNVTADIRPAEANVDDVFLLEGEMVRVRPRHNPQVNQWWMCDRGRRDLDSVNTHRLSRHYAGGSPIAAPLAVDLFRKALESGPVIPVVSLWNTNEEMAAIRKVIDTFAPGAPVSFLGREVEPDVVYPKFTVPGDRNPNRAGAGAVFGADAVAQGIVPAREALARGGDVLAFLGMAPGNHAPADLRALMPRAAKFVMVTAYATTMVRAAAVALAGAVPLEKSGAFTNQQGLAQAFTPGKKPPGLAAADLEIYQTLLGERDPATLGLTSAVGAPGPRPVGARV
ncbi:MAG: (2Fe-2S)-binding protein [Planctomycetes bacterium]|nr:(2Fe-2S)-binding protein [Planctomycetota bacterium]